MSDVYSAPQGATEAGPASGAISDAYDADAGAGWVTSAAGLIAYGARRAAV